MKNIMGLSCGVACLRSVFRLVVLMILAVGCSHIENQGFAGHHSGRESQNKRPKVLSVAAAEAFGFLNSYGFRTDVKEGHSKKIGLPTSIVELASRNNTEKEDSNPKDGIATDGLPRIIGRCTPRLDHDVNGRAGRIDRLDHEQFVKALKSLRGPCQNRIGDSARKSQNQRYPFEPGLFLPSPFGHPVE